MFRKTAVIDKEWGNYVTLTLYVKWLVLTGLFMMSMCDCRLFHKPQAWWVIEICATRVGGEVTMNIYKGHHEAAYNQYKILNTIHSSAKNDERCMMGLQSLSGHLRDINGRNNDDCAGWMARSNGDLSTRLEACWKDTTVPDCRARESWAMANGNHAFSRCKWITVTTKSVQHVLHLSRDYGESPTGFPNSSKLPKLCHSFSPCDTDARFSDVIPTMLWTWIACPQKDNRAKAKIATHNIQSLIG